MEKLKNPWSWIPGCYFAEGGPFVIVSAVSAVVFKSIGMSNQELAFWSGLLMLPWSVKPLWTPLLDIYLTKRHWVIGNQFLMAALFLLLSALFAWGGAVWALIALFFVLAFASATHDAAVDGLYMIALSPNEQSFFAGMRGMFYRFAMVAVQGGLVVLAGAVGKKYGNVEIGWAGAMGLAGAVLLLLALWHTWVLPKKEEHVDESMGKAELSEFFLAFLSFFRKKGVIPMLSFLFVFRMAESLLGNMSKAFMLDPVSAGGLGMTLEQQGVLYGTFGVIALIAGGISGGMLASFFGFHKVLWILVCAINLPDLVYVYLAWVQPESMWVIGVNIAVEQFGYGLGYTVYMLALLAFAEDSGKFKTSHFALMTGLGIFGLMVPAAISGEICHNIGGYFNYFWLVVMMTVPSFLVCIPLQTIIRRDFGKK